MRLFDGRLSDWRRRLEIGASPSRHPRGRSSQWVNVYEGPNIIPAYAYYSREEADYSAVTRGRGRGVEMIIVTGAEGFIGKNLVRLLERQGKAVFTIDRAIPTSRNGVIADIRKPDIAKILPKDAEAIIHLAALSRSKDCEASPIAAWRPQCQCHNANLIKASLEERGVRKFILASSEWV